VQLSREIQGKIPLFFKIRGFRVLLLPPLKMRMAAPQQATIMGMAVMKVGVSTNILCTVKQFKRTSTPRNKQAPLFAIPIYIKCCTITSSYDTEQQKFSGAYSYNDTSIYVYGGTHYQYKSKGKSNYDELGWVVEENDYEYGDGTDYYRSSVVEPLVSNSSCNVFREGELVISTYVWVAVSGREVVQYKQGDKEGTFEIDYGNGECDNIIYITENGIRVKVDLGSGWMCGDAKEG
jgi:hypothetical protein